MKSNNNSYQNQIKNKEHHHIIHSICKHVNNEHDRNNKNKNKNNRDATPIQKLRLKINHLENQIKNKSFI